MGAFRGGAKGATCPFFSLYFQIVFEASKLLYCCMAWKVKFSFRGGGGGGFLVPLFLNFLDPPPEGFRPDYEYEIEYEYNFLILVFRLHIITTQTHFIL